MASNKLAKSLKINRISAVWIIPIITLIMGVWMVYAHFADQGVAITLLADDANGITAGKTVIKSRSVDVGIIESVTLSKDYQQVVLKGRIYPNMEPLLKNDSVFWLVKPQIGREGVSGLGTLLSGVYIELIPGNEKSHFDHNPFNLSDNPPLAGPNVQGIRINLNSSQSDVLPRGAPVMFRGFTVGNVETSNFDINARQMKYQLFIPKPYDVLVTDNVRFWKEGGVNFSLSPRGANLDIPSLAVLLSGGISFDVPTGSKFGAPAKSLTTYELYTDKNAIQDSQYTNYHEFLLFFTDSISGLSAGAPVEYRGIRLGTVSKVPFFTPDMLKSSSVLSYNIPVLIHIEPGRLTEVSKDRIDLTELLIQEQKAGLRASLKSINFLTGSLYVDLDFYPELKDEKIDPEEKEFGFDTIATISTGLSQIQLKLIQTLDNFNQLPLNKTVTEFNQSLAEIKKLVNSLNKITTTKEMQNLPRDMKKTLASINATLEGLQPGSTFNNQLTNDLKKFESLMDQLTPLLNTLNDKSNALIFAAPKKSDPQPKAKGN